MWEQRRGNSKAPLAIGFATALLYGCGATDVIADINSGEALDASPAAGTEDAGSSGAGAAWPADREVFCRGEPALWTARGDGQSELVCAAQLAARSFGHALCVCGSVSGFSRISTSSSAPGALDAAVAINGGTQSGAPLPVLDIEGDLTHAGQSPASLMGGSEIAGDLRSSAPLALLVAGGADERLRVAGDAWLPAISSLDPGLLSVAGDLYLTPEESSGVAPSWNAAEVSGETQRANLELQPPCPCSDEQRIDVAQTVEWARTHNDNAALGFTAGQLAAIEQPTSHSLPCGRYYFDAISGPAVLTLRIDQPVAIFVGDVLGYIEVEMGEQGELDLFVAGWFQPSGGILGDRARPSATRLYVHDQPAPGPVVMFSEVASNFYGPTVGVQTLDLVRHGSMLVRDLVVSAPLTVHYDARVTADASCRSGNAAGTSDER